MRSPAPAIGALIVLFALASGCAALPGGERLYAERPFEPPRSYAGGVVVTEIFVPGSSALEPTLQQLAGYYPDTYMVPLAYHVHIPPPQRYYRNTRLDNRLNVLANPAGADRARYYDVVDRTAALVDGEPVDLPAPSGEQIPQGRYNLLRDAIDREFRFIPPVTIALEVDRQSSSFTIAVEVRPLIDLAGHDLVLRVALAERESFVPGAQAAGPPGRYDENVHPFVVRHFLGGVDGYPIAFSDGSFRIQQHVSLDHVAHSLMNWLNEEAARLGVTEGQQRLIDNPEMIGAGGIYVVAFVQREQDRRILQAAVWYPE